MSQDDTDRWLDVLAGKAAASDSETRKAAALRDILLKESEAAEPLDAAATTRIMNTLRARQAFADPTPQVPARANPLAALWAWLFPEGGHPGRYAALAAVALAVVAGPAIYQQVMHPGSEAEDPGTMKGLPTQVVVDTPRPEQAAAALQAVLSQGGVTAQVQVDGDDRLVDASVPADRALDIGAGMRSLNLVLPPDGQVSIRFRKSP